MSAGPDAVQVVRDYAGANNEIMKIKEIALSIAEAARDKRELSDIGLLTCEIVAHIINRQYVTHAGREIEMHLRYNRPMSYYIIRTLISIQACQRSSWEMRPEERYPGQGSFLEGQDSSRILSRMSQLPRSLPLHSLVSGQPSLNTPD
ncbi:hypothetical protein Ac2012v2_007486 [Leucoagaricus gongylophorus]